MVQKLQVPEGNTIWTRFTDFDCEPKLSPSQIKMAQDEMRCNDELWRWLADKATWTRWKFCSTLMLVFRLHWSSEVSESSGALSKHDSFLSEPGHNFTFCPFFLGPSTSSKHSHLLSLHLISQLLSTCSFLWVCVLSFFCILHWKWYEHNVFVWIWVLEQFSRSSISALVGSGKQSRGWPNKIDFCNWPSIDHQITFHF